METITHPTLVQLVAAGAVRVVVAVGQPGGWWTLTVLYLQQVGLSRFKVDTAGVMLTTRTCSQHAR